MKAKHWIVMLLVAGMVLPAMATPGGPVIVTEDGEVLTAKGQLKGPGRRPPHVIVVAPKKDPGTGAEDLAAVVGSGNAFATDLYARLAGKEKGNLFFSPASIHTALAMTYAGARGNTEKQMYATLRFPYQKRPILVQVGMQPVKQTGVQVKPWSQKDVHLAFGALIKKLNTPRKGHDGKPAYELIVANALWGQKGYPFKEEFTKTVKANYDAGLEEVDYVKATEASRKKINAWVEKKTKQKIKNLIPQGAIGELTRLVLTNAVYFKSNWDEKFEKSATREGVFRPRASKRSRIRTIRVPFMHQQESHNYLETDAFQAVELYYRYGDLSMVIFLPRKLDGLAAFEKALTAKNLAKWIKQMKSTPVRLSLPKFKFTSQFRLAETLKAMGMVDAFSLATADFSGMTSMDKLFISAVIHKAFVAVDEEGTEAAAATAVEMALGMKETPKNPKVFKADHPFVFMIRHRDTGSIMFMGRVMNPKQ